MAKERLSRSDKGVMALVHSFMKDGMGLSPKTITLVMKRIRDQGEFGNMKNHMRGLSGSTYKRINQAIDMAEEDAAKMSKGKPEEGKEEGKEEAAEKDVEAAETQKPKAKEEVKESFLHYLINETGTEAYDDSGEVDYTGSDDEKLTSRQLQQKKKQMMSDPQRKSLDKKMSTASTPQEKIAAENKRHQLAIKKIRQAGNKGTE